MSNSADLFNATTEDLDIAVEDPGQPRTFDIYRRFDRAPERLPMNSAIFVARCFERLSEANRTGALDACPMDSVGGLAALPGSVGGEDIGFPQPFNPDTRSYASPYAVGTGPITYNPVTNSYVNEFGVAGLDFQGVGADAGSFLEHGGGGGSDFSNQGSQFSQGNVPQNPASARGQAALASALDKANQEFQDALASGDPDAIAAAQAKQTAILNQMAQGVPSSSVPSDQPQDPGPAPPSPGPPPVSPAPLPVKPPVQPPLAAKKKFPWGTVALAGAALGAVIFHKDLGL